MAGLAAAKRRRRRGGRPLAITGEKMDAILAALGSGMSKAAACRNFEVKRTTLSRHWQESTGQSHGGRTGMTAKSKRLSVLSEAEHEALYRLPDFNDSQQLDFLSMSEAELVLATSGPGLLAQMYCIIQIVYFKAKQTFFRFDWPDAQGDTAFVLSRYFHGEAFESKSITDHEPYTQRRQITDLFGYQQWAGEFLPRLTQQAAQITRRDVTPSFVATELIVWLNEYKIVRPAHTTLQDLISDALSTERRRLGGLLTEVLDEPIKTTL